MLTNGYWLQCMSLRQLCCGAGHSLETTGRIDALLSHGRKGDISKYESSLPR